jgi:hypothetical protein
VVGLDHVLHGPPKFVEPPKLGRSLTSSNTK